jgi:uncharacterized protein (TIGR00290 family)
MESRNTTALCWSGGKDCSLSLHRLRSAGDTEVPLLLTTVTEGYDRISMHGVRRELLERQADALGMGLQCVTIPKGCSDREYRGRMAAAMEDLLNQGITSVAFGDIFLEDVRRYREENLAELGVEARFPLWGADTSELAREFTANGFRAAVTCVDTEQLPAEFAGRVYDEAFIADLPEGVDPCGENGEFHTFVYDGPVFREPVSFERGEPVMREDRFCFYDLELPVGVG